MPREDIIKNRIEELLSSEILAEPKEYKYTLVSGQPEEENKSNLGLELAVKKNFQELDCLNEIENYINQKPSDSVFFEWLCKKISSVLQYPEVAAAAITYKSKVFGNPEAITLPSKISANMSIGPDILGFIHLAYMDKRTFMEEEIAFVKAIAGRVSSYLENQKLVTELEKRAYELSVLNELGQVLSTNLSSEDIAKIIFEYTSRLMEVQDFFVAYYDHDSEIITYPYLMINGEEMESFSRPLGKGLTDYIIRNGSALLFSNNVAQNMEKIGLEFIVVGNDTPVQSWLGVPIIFENSVLGVISLQTSEKAGLYTAEDKELLTAVSRQSAVAINNSLLFLKSQNALEKADLLYKGSDRVIQASDSLMLLDAIVEFSPANQYQFAELFLFDKPWGDTSPEFLSKEAVYQNGSSIASNEIIKHSEFPFWELAISGHPILLTDVNNDPRFNMNIGKRGFYSEITSLGIFPLVAGTEYLGIVLLTSKNHIDLDDSSMQQIDSLVNQAATVLNNLKLNSNLKFQLSEMESLQRLLSRDAWSSYLSKGKNQNWGYEFNYVETNPISGNGNSFESSSITSPLRVRGEVIGGLAIKSDDNSSISEEENEFLKAVAEQVSQALERSRLIEQTQKSAVELQTVAQVSFASSTLLEPFELLQSVVDLAQNSFGLYHAHIYLLDETESKLVLCSGSGKVGRKMVEDGWVIYLDENSIVARTARSLHGHIENNVKNTPYFLPNPLLPDTYSEMAVPMIAGKKLLGIFDLQSDLPNHFTEEDLQTFTTLAGQTAVALQNARLFEEQSITLDKLRELDLLKTSFLANMSHELRTPLNSILGFTQVILEGIDGPLTDYMVSDLQLIEKNGKHLLYLINEVLDMAKIESGRMSLTIEKINLRELIEDVLETTSTQARDKSISLKLDTTNDQELFIKADHMRIRQILLNLVGNSIKFTETGGVTVRLEQKTKEVIIFVEDTGIGIPPNKLETIFEAFSQVDTSTTRKAGGTGLGLPISRKLVEMHGGKLWAESEGLGKGTRMHLVLPVNHEIK